MILETNELCSNGNRKTKGKLNKKFLNYFRFFELTFEFLSNYNFILSHL